MTDGIRQITSVDEFRALAHPLRVQLLAALREHGPATATELARRFDTDSGSTSYHLRKLAEFGFIADAGDPGHPRARRWQAVHRINDWDPVAMAATEHGREAAAVIRHHQVATLAADVRAYEAAEPTLPAEWIEASGLGDLLVRLTPASLNLLWQRFYAHVDELVALDAADPAARPVSVIVSGLPPMTAARHRYVLLTSLTWLPTGLYGVSLVLLLLERGLDLGTVAALGIAYGVTVAVLELPTGGLSDVLGHRPVLLASAAAGAIGLALLGLSGSLWLLAASAVARGVARALSSGPAEAWYVDTVRQARGAATDDELDAVIGAGLARGGFAASAALGVGTLGGAVLAYAWPGSGATALAVPVLLAAALEAVRLLVTAAVLPPGVTRPVGALLREVPATVRAGVRLAVRDHVLARVLVVAAAGGVALATLELLTPAWLARLSGGTERGVLAYGLVAAAGFAADALGTTLSAPLTRRLGGPARAAAAGTLVAALALAGLAGTAALSGLTGTIAAGAAYLLLFAGMGSAWAPLATLLHARVDTGERATMLSAQSLLLQVGGALGAVALGGLATVAGPGPAYAVAALILAAACTALRSPAPTPLLDTGTPAKVTQLAGQSGA